mmetsp:Transcript_56253/g.137986  ORF Transcript_56253/g.137986 Transcript_56253/m.137986 type:complete len:410 (-) Transcript_56253:1-1230(-)
MNKWDEAGEETVTTRDLYEVLGVERDATDSQLKRAYHKLAMVHHPDKRANNPDGSDKTFKEIGYAYHILSDPDKRQIYDLGGSEAVEQQEGMANINIDMLLLNVLMWETGQKMCFLCVLMLMLMEVIILPLLIALRLDGSLEWSWFGVFAPLWIPLGLMVLGLLYAPFQIKMLFKAAGDDAQKVMQARAGAMGCVVMGVLFGCFAGSLAMLCERLEGDSGLTYVHVLIPVLVVEGLITLSLCAAPMKDALEALVWKTLRVAFLVLVAMKLDGSALSWFVALGPLIVWSTLSLAMLTKEYMEHKQLRAKGKERNVHLDEEASKYAPFFFGLRACVLGGILISVVLLSLKLDLGVPVSYAGMVAPSLFSFAVAYGMIVAALLFYKPSGLEAEYTQFPPGGGDDYGTFQDKV